MRPLDIFLNIGAENIRRNSLCEKEHYCGVGSLWKYAAAVVLEGKGKGVMDLD